MIEKIALPPRRSTTKCRCRSGFESTNALSKRKGITKDSGDMDVVRHHDGAAQRPSTVCIQSLPFTNQRFGDRAFGQNRPPIFRTQGKEIFRIGDRYASAAQQRPATIGYARIHSIRLRQSILVIRLRQVPNRRSALGRDSGDTQTIARERAPTNDSDGARSDRARARSYEVSDPKSAIAVRRRGSACTFCRCRRGTGRCGRLSAIRDGR